MGLKADGNKGVEATNFGYSRRLLPKYDDKLFFTQEVLTIFD